MEKSQPGVLISLFIVPPSTPVWLWATVSAAFLLVLKCYLLFRLKRKTTGEREVGFRSTLVRSVGVLILLLELLSRFLHRCGPSAPGSAHGIIRHSISPS